MAESAELEAWKRLVRKRMSGRGNYIVVADPAALDLARAAAMPGDTISVHPPLGDGPSRLYEVQGDGSLLELSVQDA